MQAKTRSGVFLRVFAEPPAWCLD